VLLLVPVIIADAVTEPGGVPEQHAVELTAEAHEAARDGHCEIVAKLDAQVHNLDSDYYERTFQTDPAIEACLHATPTPPERRDRFTVGAGVTIGNGLQADLRVGWMVTPWFAVFGSVFIGSKYTDFGDDYRVYAGGARLWYDRFFVDGRLGGAQAYIGDCSSGGPTCPASGVGEFVGAGLEVTRQVHYGLEVHVGVGGGAGVHVVGGGIGTSFY
jgi:hypothetical protein